MPHWKVTVIADGSDAPSAEVAVDAANWMEAVQKSRVKMGEDNAMPRGAGCAFEPSGLVVVTDKEHGRRFLLNKEAAAAPANVATPTKKASAAKAESATAAAKRALDRIQQTLGLKLIDVHTDRLGGNAPMRYNEQCWYAKPELSNEVLTQLAKKIIALSRTRIGGGKTFLKIAIYDHLWDKNPTYRPRLVVTERSWNDRGELLWPAQDGGQGAASNSNSPPSGTLEVVAESDDGGARMAAVFEASQDLRFMKTPLEAMRFGTRLMVDLVPSALAAAYLWESQTGLYRCIAALGDEDEQTISSSVPATVGLFAVAHTHQQPVRHTGRGGSYVEKADGLWQADATTHLYGPIIGAQRWGLLRLVNRQEETAYTGEDADIIDYIALQLANFFDRRNA